jgi:hypothetical protein
MTSSCRWDGIGVFPIVSQRILARPKLGIMQLIRMAPKFLTVRMVKTFSMTRQSVIQRDQIALTQLIELDHRYP